MMDLNCKFTVYLLIAVFSLNRIANGLNIETELESGRALKREISKRSAVNALPIGAEERKQRFCLTRLRDALQSVCSSGSDRLPYYFNPSDPNQNQAHVSGNSSNFHLGMERTPRHYRNDISAMGQHNRRPTLRRRSRRNIVRQCCNKPCSYESMRKYCSASTRQTPLKASPVIESKVSISNQELSRSVHGNPTGFSLGDLDYAEANDNNRIGDSDQVDTPPYPIQCVPVPDLKSYYRKLYQQQSRKDGQTRHSNGSVIENIRSGTSNALLDNAEKPTMPSDKLLNTNTVIYDDSSTAPSSPEYDSNFSQKSSTEEVPTRKQNELEDISQVDEISSQVKTPRTSNAITAKPITRFISLPRGTHDYIYYY